MAEVAELEEVETQEEEVILEDEIVEDVVEEATDEPNEEVEEDDGIEISLGDESLTSEDEEEAKAPSWVKDLRKSNREMKRELREAKQKLVEKETTQQVEPDVVIIEVF